MKAIIEDGTNYLKYRGKCKEMSEALCLQDPSLKLVRGHYWCPIWNTEEPHWWCEREDGTIVDPTKLQFPSSGCGEYIHYDGTTTCEYCGKTSKEEDTYFVGHHTYCSYEHYGKHIGF